MHGNTYAQRSVFGINLVEDESFIIARKKKKKKESTMLDYLDVSNDIIWWNSSFISAAQD